MKWFTHQSIAVGTALALGLPPAGVAGVIFGSVLPDVVDQRLSRLTPHPQKTFNCIHRGASHWFGWYAALLVMALVWPQIIHLPTDLWGLLGDVRLPRGFTAFAKAQSPSLLAGIAFGALMHVALDMLTPSGVPLTPFSRKNKFSLKVCSTGSVGEYVFLVVGLAVIAVIGYERVPEIMATVRKFL